MRQRPVVLLAAVALLGLLVIAAWQASWPSAIFGVKRDALVQAGTSPSPARPAPSPAPSSAAPTPGTPSSSALASPSGSVSSGPAPVPAAKGPATTVRAYFAAINTRDYTRAWRLGGINTNASYAAFASGFRQTAHDKVVILSVSGNVVTARLTARQKNGTVRVYEGTYTVEDGVISQFDVQQVG